MKCYCGNDEWTGVYKGPIRDGAWGNFIEGEVLECTRCSVQRLPESLSKPLSFYEGVEYRKSLKQAHTASEFVREHFDEQFLRVELLGNVKDLSLADVGCAGGAFLDQVETKEKIAIEPCEEYKDSLINRFIYADSLETAINAGTKVDIVTCFSTLEHVEDPLGFLEKIKMILEPRGTFILTTNNRDDYLMRLPEYRKYFYRTQHTWYFNHTSLAHIFLMAGFNVLTDFFHRVENSHIEYWEKFKEPPKKVKYITESSDYRERYIAHSMETEGISDFLYAEGHHV